ncbi:MAG: dTDP-4-dehydrorhamnose reductase [Bosea sp. (in: a-proteobacteria)]
MPDILLTGGTGQVGTELRGLAWPEGVQLVAPTRTDCDLADPASVARYLDGKSFAAILSVGAYTAVDKAESDLATAWLVNAVAPAVLAAHAAKVGIPILHVSTDYVFDGTKTSPYLETDPVGPVGVYGASKEGGEQAIRTGTARHAIVRTSWVVSPHGNNFVKTMLRVGAQRPLLKVVDDQWGAPTVAADLARALQVITLKMMADSTAPSGTFHCCNASETTWCGLAREVFVVAAAHGGPNPEVEAITTADYPTPARRPANSRLSTARIVAEYGVDCPPWQVSVGSLVKTLLTPTYHIEPART